MLEYNVSKGILDSYHTKLKSALDSDAIIVGSGPSGLVAGYFLAKAGKKVVMFERELAPGGGIWGGGMFFNDVMVQEEAATILSEIGVELPEVKDNFYTIDSVYLASTLISKAVEAGVTLLNMISIEDIIFAKDESIGGVVLNWAPVHKEHMHVDPLMAISHCVLDATGHPSEIVNVLTRKNEITLNTETGKVMGEKSLKCRKAELATVENTCEIYPRLFVSGMAANGVAGAYRMGPVFGGMIRSGKKVAEQMLQCIDSEAPIYD
jgi:thiamine thiazole synthase